MSNTTGGIVRPAIVVFALLSALTGLIYPRPSPAPPRRPSPRRRPAA
jgi:hypothetical protein